jgi:hypothetical protein
LPVPVFLKRLAAARLVLIFGITSSMFQLNVWLEVESFSRQPSSPDPEPRSPAHRNETQPAARLRSPPLLLSVINHLPGTASHRKGTVHRLFTSTPSPGVEREQFIGLPQVCQALFSEAEVTPWGPISLPYCALPSWAPVPRSPRL